MDENVKAALQRLRIIVDDIYQDAIGGSLAEKQADKALDILDDILGEDAHKEHTHRFRVSLDASLLICSCGETKPRKVPAGA